MLLASMGDSTMMIRFSLLVIVTCPLVIDGMEIVIPFGTPDNVSHYDILPIENIQTKVSMFPFPSFPSRGTSSTSQFVPHP
jgi:hypothetical protein